MTSWPSADQPDRAILPETPGPGDDSACPLPIRRGRPSVAEAEQLSGKILDASWDVLLAAGFENFTFDRVARHAHIGKATIYSRFASKCELMQAMLARRIEVRRAFIMAQGADLPLVEAFSLRASEILNQLYSPDGLLMERLIDWLDQETHSTGPGTRAQAYRHAVHSIAQSLQEVHDAGEVYIADVEQAARFWLEGILGHARLAVSEGPEARADTERWSRRYAEFFFAGVRALGPGETP